MMINEARNIVDDYYGKDEHSPKEDDLFIRSMEYLIAEEKNPVDMMNLANFYFDLGNFEYALKYYEMAAACEYVPAYKMLASIWYYGRTGTKDRKKAHEYFLRLRNKGIEVADLLLSEPEEDGQK